MKRFRRRRVAGVALCFAGWLLGCARTSHHDDAGEVASEAGQGTVGSGGAAGRGGRAAFGGSSGADGAGGLMLAGFPNEEEMGAAGGYTAQPLGDTRLCGNVFERVQQLPDEPLSFSASFDGEPVEVRSGSSPSEPPFLGVFRFGPTHVEALSFDFEFPGHSGAVSLNAVECNLGGQLMQRQDGELVAVLALTRGTLSCQTISVDGFTGVSSGSLYSEWSNDAGEEHVFTAEFAMRAVMGDARAQRP